MTLGVVDLIHELATFDNSSVLPSEPRLEIDQEIKLHVIDQRGINLVDQAIASLS
jgi:hypothetical protein